MKTFSILKTRLVTVMENGTMSFQNQKSRRIRTAFIRVLTLIGLLLSLLPVTSTRTVVQAQGERKQVLLLNSYHPGYKWSDDVARAISDKFGEEGNVELRVEYLDTKHLDSQEYLDSVYQFLQVKYLNNSPDLIMSSDDAALNFLFKHADTLFPDVPVVFAGANYFDEKRLEGYERFTGISEEADVAGTLDVALQLHPDVRKVVVVNDKTVTGQKVREKVTSLASQYPQIKFEFAQDMTMDELRQYAGKLQPDTLVLLTVFFRDSTDTFYEYNQFTTLIAKSSAVPVYGLWDFSLGYGIVGGKLTSGYTEGERAADVAIRILHGENPQNIPVNKQTQSQYFFDYKVMQSLGIPLSTLPKDSTVINRPVSFYGQNKVLIWVMLTSFVILASIIVLLSINNNARRKAQAELFVRNQELAAVQNSLQERVTSRTVDLATVAQISTSTATIRDPFQLLATAVHLTQRGFNLYHAHVFTYRKETDDLKITACGYKEGDVHEGTHGTAIIPFNQEKSLVARAARTRKPVIVNDVYNEPGWLPNPLLPDTRAELAVPMIVGDELLGVLDVQSDRLNAFTEEDANIQMTLAAQIATALQNAQSYTDAKTKAELEALINTIGQKIQRSTTVEDTLQIAIREVGIALSASRVRASLSRSENNENLVASK